MKSSQYSGTTEFPPFNPSGWEDYNICVSEKPTDSNPKRCWMNIGIDKLEKFVKAGNYQWLFDTNVRGERLVYYTSAKKVFDVFVKEKLKTIENGTPRYAFYIDYAKGVLYTAAPESTGRSILELKKVTSGEEYQKYMKPIPGKDSIPVKDSILVKDDMKIGKIVRFQFIPKLVEYCKDGRLTPSDIEILFHECLMTDVPILKRASEVPKKPHSRYYAPTINLFGEDYRVSDHWFASDKEKLRMIVKRLNMKIDL